MQCGAQRSSLWAASALKAPHWRGDFQSWPRKCAAPALRRRQCWKKSHYDSSFLRLHLALPVAGPASTPRPLLPARGTLKWAGSAHSSGRRWAHPGPLLLEDCRGCQQLARDGCSILARRLGGGRDGGGGNWIRTGSGCRTWPSSGRKCSSFRGRGDEAGGSGSSCSSRRGSICCSSSRARFGRGRKRVKHPAATGAHGEGGPPLLESRGPGSPPARPFRTQALQPTARPAPFGTVVAPAASPHSL